MKRTPGMFQKRLFAKFELDIYLKNVMTRSLEFIHEYGTETSIHDMIDNLVERIDLTPLSLQAEQSVERIIPGHGGRFVEYVVPFSGDDIFWYLSPGSLKDSVPMEINPAEWVLPMGSQLVRPSGEVFRGELLIIAESEAHYAAEMQLVHELVAEQTIRIDNFIESFRTTLEDVSPLPPRSNELH